MLIARPPSFIAAVDGIPNVAGLVRSVIVQPSGEPYLERYDVVATRDFTVRIHHWHSSDDQRAPHDHPWPNVTVVLAGHLIEHTRDGRRHLGHGAVAVRAATDAHRIELVTDDAWTLFTMGRIERRWGFHTDVGWVHWTDWPHAGHYLEPDAGDEALTVGRRSTGRPR